MEEQQARITAAAVAPRPIRVAIAEAQGLLCAEEVVTERPMPGFDQAAIDGYAVRSVDVLGVGEISSEEIGEPSDDTGGADDTRDGLVLPVMGTIEAGTRTPSRLQPKQAVRVQTGAPLPTLADAVLPLRWTDGGTVARPDLPRGAVGRLRAPRRRRRAARRRGRAVRHRSSGPPRSGCWRRSAANGCWCIRGRGCR